MGYPRAHLIDLDVTPYYHCVTRCVRRAFLCGVDRFSGKSFDHRKAWIEARIELLAQHFSIGVCAYAVMSNHVHLVLRVDSDKAKAASESEVIARWRALFSVPENLNERADREELISLWRSRLASISWFMRCLNEPLARMANKEDGCTGRFWEGRFKSQALLDRRAVLQCMAYVDLNPIRAGAAETIFSSLHTSIRARITGRDDALVPFASKTEGLTISFRDYKLLLEATCRSLRGDQNRVPLPEVAHVMKRIGFHFDAWQSLMGRRPWYRVVGSVNSVRRYTDRLHGKGIRNACTI